MVQRVCVGSFIVLERVDGKAELPRGTSASG